MKKLARLWPGFVSFGAGIIIGSTWKLLILFGIVIFLFGLFLLKINKNR